MRSRERKATLTRLSRTIVPMSDDGTMFAVKGKVGNSCIVTIEDGAFFGSCTGFAKSGDCKHGGRFDEQFAAAKPTPLLTPQAADSYCHVACLAHPT